MTREEAIWRLENCLECTDCFTCGSHDNALVMAVAALREQEERSKGCAHCTKRKGLSLRNDLGHLWIENGRLNNLYDECKINFCPMCGRKLEVDA